MKRRMLPVWIGVLAWVSVAGAQTSAPARRAPVPEDRELKGEPKIRWVCDRLSLNDEQKQQMEALIGGFYAEMAAMEGDAQPIMMRIRDKYGEIQKALADKNYDLVEKLQIELRNLAPTTMAENHFFEAFEPILTPEQKAKLPQLREDVKFAEAPPTRQPVQPPPPPTQGQPPAQKVEPPPPAQNSQPPPTPPGANAVRPIHVLLAARDVNLSSEQHRWLEKVLDEYRTNLKTPPKDAPAPDDKVAGLVQSVRAILTPAQATEFDKKLEIRRATAPPPPPPPPPPPAQQRRTMPPQVPPAPQAQPPAPAQPTPPTPPVQPERPTPPTPPVRPTPPPPPAQPERPTPPPPPTPPPACSPSPRASRPSRRPRGSRSGA